MSGASNLALVAGPAQAQALLHSGGDESAAAAPVAAITVGWQEYEGEQEDLASKLGRAVTDLRLHGRAEQLFRRHPELRDANAHKQRLILEAERYYQLRLGYAMEAALDLWAGEAHGSLLQDHRREAVRALRTLDRQHLRRLRAWHDAYDSQLSAQSARALAQERLAIEEQLTDCGTVVVSGGHVAALLNRLRLFGMRELLASRQVIAWGAGAMACTERVLLFHDRGPLGPRHPAFLDHGLGLTSGVVALPAARRRLALAESARLSLLARRAAPAQCLLLDGEATALIEAGRLQHGGRSLHRLAASGRVVKARVS